MQWASENPTPIEIPPSAAKPEPKPVFMGPKPEDVIQHHNPPPHPKPITVELAYHSISNCYKVMRITDTVYYLPGTWLSVETVHQICLNPQWSAVMVDYDYLAGIGALFGLATNVGIHAAVV